MILPPINTFFKDYTIPTVCCHCLLSYSMIPQSIFAFRTFITTCSAVCSRMEIIMSRRIKTLFVLSEYEKNILKDEYNIMQDLPNTDPMLSEVNPLDVHLEDTINDAIAPSINNSSYSVQNIDPGFDSGSLSPKTKTKIVQRCLKRLPILLKCMFGILELSLMLNMRLFDSSAFSMTWYNDSGWMMYCDYFDSICCWSNAGLGLSFALIVIGACVVEFIIICYLLNDQIMRKMQKPVVALISVVASIFTLFTVYYVALVILLNLNP